MSPSYSSLLEGSSLHRESLIFSCSHLLFSYYDSGFFLCALFLEYVEGNHFLLAHIPRMNESHDLGRSFKVVITISYSSLIALSWHRTLPFGVFKDDTCPGASLTNQYNITFVHIGGNIKKKTQKFILGMY